MFKSIVIISVLAIVVTSCYTIQSHPIVKGVVDGDYYAKSVDYQSDCYECHATEEVAEYNLMPMYEPEKVHGEMEFYSGEIDHIALFYGEIGWWYRYTPVAGSNSSGGYVRDGSDDGGIDDNGDNVPPSYHPDGGPHPLPHGGTRPLPVINPGTPTKSGNTQSNEPKTKVRPQPKEEEGSSTRSSADRPSEPTKSRNNNSGSNKGSRK